MRDFVFLQVTLLGRGSGASLVTALTASTKAKGLFARVWATNGDAAFSNKTLSQANQENKVRSSTIDINY